MGGKQNYGTFKKPLQPLLRQPAVVNGACTTESGTGLMAQSVVTEENLIFQEMHVAVFGADAPRCLAVKTTHILYMSTADTANTANCFSGSKDIHFLRPCYV